MWSSSCVTPTVHKLDITSRINGMKTHTDNTRKIINLLGQQNIHSIIIGFSDVSYIKIV